MTAAFENIGVPVNKKLEITLDVLASKLTDKRAYTYQQISLFHENATAKLQRHVNANKPQTVDKLLDFNYEF